MVGDGVASSSVEAMREVVEIRTRLEEWWGWVGGSKERTAADDGRVVEMVKASVDELFIIAIARRVQECGILNFMVVNYCFVGKSTVSNYVYRILLEYVFL